MQSRNPIFTRSKEFNGKANSYGNPTYPGNGQAYGGYGSDPAQWGVGTPGQVVQPVDEGRISIDSVVQKTAVTMGVLIVSAALTWLLSGDIGSSPMAAQRVYTLALVGAFGGFALAMVNSFKREVSPVLVIAYAALEGLFVGAMSKVFEAQWPGIVVGAVIGTFAASAGTLAAYKYFNIKVGNKFRRWVTAMMFGFVGLTMLDFVLGFFHASFGFNGFGTLGLISSVVGLGLGVLMLILDFDFVERGVAAGLPERESWRAAFGLTVTIVWIYIEILRILAIFRGR
ncbi:MAG: Bax inhibitor-1/YccA family protein [Actinomycetota bacterium]|nr:Bax inhibitor-1/YccA family protein [Actinomycetota bacterium]